MEEERNTKFHFGRIQSLYSLDVDDAYTALKGVCIFESHYSEFKQRYYRYLQFLERHRNNINDKECVCDLYAYQDLLFVSIRSLFIENKRYKLNYTAQLLFSAFDRTDYVQKINNVLEKSIYGDDEDKLENNNYLSIRKAIKFFTDRYLCHYDSLDSKDAAMVNIFTTTMANPYGGTSLKTIGKELIDIVDAGMKDCFRPLSNP